jgi:hypothetical protein
MRSTIVSHIPLHRNFKTRTSSLRFFFALCFMLITPFCLAKMHIAVDQVGYETTAQKQARWL